jgi:S1-C subfamily serine protease
VPVAMAERDNPLARLSTSIDPRQNLVPRLGILGVNLDREIMKLRPSARVGSGVVVVSTVPGAIESHEGRLAPGDIVYAVNRTPVNGLAELRAVLEKMNVGDSVVLHLDRGGGLVYLAFTID